MHDQKPTLDYRKLEPSRIKRRVEMAIGTVFMAFALASLSAGVMYWWYLLGDGEGKRNVAATGVFGVLLPCLGLLLLWPALVFLKRR